MKTQVNPPDTQDRGFNAERFWRHYVAAVDSEDATWHEEQEKGGHAGRIFMFLLLFHVFLITAVVLFNLVAEKPKPVFAEHPAATKKTGTSTKKNQEPDKGKAAPVIPAVKLTDTVEVVVGQGDSLKSIADKAGMTAEELARLNQMDPNIPLVVGSSIQVPKAKSPPATTPVVQPAKVQEVSVAVHAAPPPAKPPAAEVFHAVTPAPPAAPSKKAESAPQAKPPAVVDKLPQDKTKPKLPEADTPPKPKPTETKAVAKAEEPKKATPPKPEDAPKPAAAKPAATERPAAVARTHTVKPKETFYSISRKYHVPVDDLMKLNGYSDPGRLREGAGLKIPAK